MTAHRPETLRQLGEASHWLARLRAEPDSEEAVTSWLQWCEADRANAEAFERVQQLWRQMDQVSDQLDDSGTRAAERSPIVAGGGPLLGALPKRRVGLGGLAIAGTLFCAVGAGAFWFVTRSSAPEVALDATLPENRLTSLPDGSSIHLSAKTSVAVDFGTDTRRLRMSSGEAYFRVRPDKKRPFVVNAGPLEVMAVGTAFDVKADDGQVSVTVQEGLVAVAPIKTVGGTASDTAWHVGPGYQFQYSEHDGSARLSSVDTAVVLAWREGRLEYVNTPLALVVLDVNRYARRPVALTEPSVGQLTFTGTVFTDSIDGWLQGLPGALPVRVERSPMGSTLIRSAGPLSR